ncbi:MAG: cell shape determination protein CcmA [Gammaproteobacteria bacterium HGW-Gammaproteobacteria-7]|nr:MAG: cell shape determination protein CcmA [Gammaproteobacteria bacterium HGW-Gammaproteobacteria-7]
MFGGDKRRRARGMAEIETLIGPRMQVRGDLEFSGGLYIEGTVHGSIRASGDDGVLTLSERGLIEGEIHAPVVIICGQMRGDVYAWERLELGDHARVEGNINYAIIEMSAGAMVTGRLIHMETQPKQLSGPNATPEST